MLTLRLGKINNEERKFIPTKKNFFEEYIDSLKMVEEYELTQTFYNGYKYRRYNDHGEMKYTRNYKKGKITDVIEISEVEFQNILDRNKGKCIRKIRKYYIDGQFEIDVDYFLEPLNMIMVEVASNTTPLDEYIPPRGFVDVSIIDKYQNSEIFKGSIISNTFIIEGTDGVGKSTVIEALLKDGIICQDRCMEVISKNMLFDISIDKRAELYEKYLRNSEKKVIILVNNSREELESRIKMRKKLSEFDLQAFEYNQLYLETFKYMEKRNMLYNKMFLIDCTGKNREEQIYEVKKNILEI